MRPSGPAAVLALAMALGGGSIQVATADDDTDIPTHQQVTEAREAVDAEKLDLEGVRAALDAANQRLEEATIAAAQAAEAYNGARWEAKQARIDARRAADAAREAAEDADRQRRAYQEAVLTSYTHGSGLGALTSLAESEGVSELVQRSSAMRASDDAMDAQYDAMLAAQDEADEAAADADAALDEAVDAEEAARDARDAAQEAADTAAATAQEIAAEKTDLITRLSRLKGISYELAERRQAGLEARAAERAAQEREESAPPPADVPETPTEPETPTDTGPPAPPPAEPPSAPSGNAQAAIAFARSQLGEPYRWGAAGPGSWDCSGLTMGAWASGGKTLPHYSVAQYQQSTPISASELRPGDLVFWGSSSSSSSIFHVALYVGDGRIIHAPRSGRPVSEESMYYWIAPNFFARP